MTSQDKTLREMVAEMRNFADVADRCEVTNAVPAIRVWANQLEALAAALAPAAEAVVFVDGFDRGLPTLEWINKSPLSKGDRLFTTPQPAPVVDDDNARLLRLATQWERDAHGCRRDGYTDAAVVKGQCARELRAALAPKPASDEAGSA